MPDIGFSVPVIFAVPPAFIFVIKPTQDTRQTTRGDEVSVTQIFSCFAPVLSLIKSLGGRVCRSKCRLKTRRDACSLAQRSPL